MDSAWEKRLSQLDHAYQPIVNIHTGNAFGFEALLRGMENAGFETREAVFETAYEKGIFHETDLYLRRRALEKFAGITADKGTKLFYNLDTSLLESPDFHPGKTAKMIRDMGFEKDDICFELSARQRPCRSRDVLKSMASYRSQGYKVTVDDFGIGFSGLRLLYFSEPDYIKIAPYFIRNIESDPKKRLVVSTIVNFAHFAGSLVVAEGVETRDELLLCREIGCDMVQGCFVQAPQLDVTRLKTGYEKIGKIAENDKRDVNVRDRDRVADEIKWVSPISSQCSVVEVFDAFRNNAGANFFPVVNPYNEPLGIIRDSAFKDYIFSKFGRTLMENPSFGKYINRFVSKIPIADAHSTLEQLMAIYSQHHNTEGLIMVEDNQYKGILGTHSLLKIIHEKNMTQARNQNPLTRLPGNTMIHEYFSTCLSDWDAGYHLIYFDFDNLKPFNDTYGFRNGDRIILMFAEMLKKAALSENRFAGHVGGDDFFLGLKNAGDTDAVAQEMAALAKRFQKNAESFYDQKTVQKGYLTARDRDGLQKNIPLITVSGAILELPARTPRNCTIEKAGNIIAGLKKKAKAADSGLAVGNITALLTAR